MRFLFPFSIVPQGSRIIIYGAGEVGYDFYRQVITSQYAEIALWVDRQYSWFRTLNLPVDEPWQIKDAKYDLVVITAEQRSVYESICCDLHRFCVPPNKIIWKEDYTLHENIVLGYEDRDIEKELTNAVQSDACEFVNRNRLDIVIRYLYATEVLSNVSGGIGERIYTKFISIGCNAKEPTENYISAYFSEYSQKRGIKAFKHSYMELIYSMKTNGYLKEQFLPVDERGHLINGAHRVAAALACNEKVWYVRYPFIGLHYECSEKSLEEMQFTVNEIAEINKTFEELMNAGRTR